MNFEFGSQSKKTEKPDKGRISEEGKLPKNGDKVKIHYIGRVINGAIFDPTKTIEFTLGKGEVRDWATAHVFLIQVFIHKKSIRSSAD